ncbi:unnamed protein product [Effrenium voratum]|uniref:Uncharacterized protein n=2 Tax=Effrenium voratum TaxID=2562239 RepID=A0AA36NIR6_9DINO|nr:unnamed protein product [Effrenium voratum]
MFATPVMVHKEATEEDVPKVQRMYTPVNYRVTGPATQAEKVAGPAPVTRPDLNREMDRRRRGSREEGIAAKVKVSEPPKAWVPPTPLTNDGRVQAQTPAQTVRPRQMRQASPVIALPSWTLPGSTGASPCMSPLPPPPGYRTPAIAPSVQVSNMTPLTPYLDTAPQLSAVAASTARRAAGLAAAATLRREASRPAVRISSATVPPKRSVWAEVARLRQEDYYFVCVIGGAEMTGATAEFIEYLAQELRTRLPPSVAFVVNGTCGVSQAFCDGFKDQSRLVNLQNPSCLEERGLQGQDASELLNLLGDVFIFIEACPEAANVAQKALERGADLVPVRRGSFLDIPKQAFLRPSFVGESCWALLSDPTAPTAAASAAASAAVAGALAQRCRPKARLARSSSSFHASPRFVVRQGTQVMTARARPGAASPLPAFSPPSSLQAPAAQRLMLCPSAPTIHTWARSLSPPPLEPCRASASLGHTAHQLPQRPQRAFQWPAPAIEPCVLEASMAQKPRASSPLGPSRGGHASYFNA